MLPLDSLTSASLASSLSSSSSSLIVSVVEYFDGSQVIDPVVVSDSFWNGFSSRIISLLIGQFLAVMAFGIITTLASQQITKAGEWVANQWFSKTIADATRGESSTTTQTNTGTAATPRQSAAFVRKPDFIRLLLCVTLDIVGTSNEIVPVVGEVADVVWAPIAAILLRNLFGGSNVILVLEFVEEILPFTDVLPLATICWVIDTLLPASNLARLLQLGFYRSVGDEPITTTNNNDSRNTIIDVLKGGGETRATNSERSKDIFR